MSFDTGISKLRILSTVLELSDIKNIHEVELPAIGPKLPPIFSTFARDYHIGVVINHRQPEVEPCANQTDVLTGATEIDSVPEPVEAVMSRNETTGQRIPISIADILNPATHQDRPTTSLPGLVEDNQEVVEATVFRSKYREQKLPIKVSFKCNYPKPDSVYVGSQTSSTEKTEVSQDKSIKAISIGNTLLKQPKNCKQRDWLPKVSTNTLLTATDKNGQSSTKKSYGILTPEIYPNRSNFIGGVKLSSDIQVIEEDSLQGETKRNKRRIPTCKSERKLRQRCGINYNENFLTYRVANDTETNPIKIDSTTKSNSLEKARKGKNSSKLLKAPTSVNNHIQKSSKYSKKRSLEEEEKTSSKAQKSDNIYTKKTNLTRSSKINAKLLVHRTNNQALNIINNPNQATKSVGQKSSHIRRSNTNYICASDSESLSSLTNLSLPPSSPAPL